MLPVTFRVQRERAKERVRGGKDRKADERSDSGKRSSKAGHRSRGGSNGKGSASSGGGSIASISRRSVGQGIR